MTSFNTCFNSTLSFSESFALAKASNGAGYTFLDHVVNDWRLICFSDGMTEEEYRESLVDRVICTYVKPLRRSSLSHLSTFALEYLAAILE